MPAIKHPEARRSTRSDEDNAHGYEFIRHYISLHRLWGFVDGSRAHTSLLSRFSLSHMSACRCAVRMKAPSPLPPALMTHFCSAFSTLRITLPHVFPHTLSYLSSVTSQILVHTPTPTHGSASRHHSRKACAPLKLTDLAPSPTRPCVSFRSSSPLPIRVCLPPCILCLPAPQLFNSTTLPRLQCARPSQRSRKGGTRAT